MGLIGLIRAGVVGALVLGVLIVASAAPADAAPTACPACSPWWGLTSGARPTDLRSGVAVDEVQKITVDASEGEFFLLGNGQLKTIAVNASASQVQGVLEEMFGAGSVIVTLGSSETGRAFMVHFTGALTDRPVPVMMAFGGEANVTEVTQGSPDAQIVVTAENLGDASANGERSPIVIHDKLPAGLKAVSMEERVRVNGSGSSEMCDVATLTCTFAGELPPYEQLEVRVSVIVESGAAAGVNEANVSGGGAVAGKSVSREVHVGGETTFGVEEYDFTPEESSGVPDTRAGSHPFQLTSVLDLNQVEGRDSKGNAIPYPAALAKDLHFSLPPGLVGNPTIVPQCTDAQFGKITQGGRDECEPGAALGVASITFTEPGTLGFTTDQVPLFNLRPLVGEPARFGFVVDGTLTTLDTSIRTGQDYGITVDVNNITQLVGFIGGKVTFWGVPGDSRHDSQRGWACLKEYIGEELGTCAVAKEEHPRPFLTTPTSCGASLPSSVEADSWAHSGRFETFPLSEPMVSLTGCNHLPFNPEIRVSPDVTDGSTSTGLTTDVHVDQEATALNPAGLAESAVKDITVALPEGVVVNPAGADGLQACTEIQIGFQGEAEDGTDLFTPGLAEPFCPDASKIGTVRIKLPILPDALTGAVYLASQNENPFGSLVAMYLLAQDPVSGVVIKLAGNVHLSDTGQIVATFKNSPQGPLEDAELHFFGGERAPLGTPAHCGTYATNASFVPWSGNEPVNSSSSFRITSGPNGTPCPGAELPFAPSLTAGTTSIQAGGLSPFTMTMSRDDGNQSLQAIQLHMPPGLSGLLTGLKLCPEAQANAGTCGPESQIGETIVSVGLGGDPFSVRGGKVFITEGYEGAPYGLSVVNPAKAGPFDLGLVVVRAKIEVDPITAALTITTDNAGPYKIPSILDGIPLQIKHVNVTINRPGFTFNPTNCNPMSITGTLSSVEGAASSLSVPLQVTNCAVLGFKPAFSVSATGRTSRANGASLHVKLSYPKAAFGSQANISKVKVDLPRALPSRLSTLQHACPDNTFNKNPASCPAESRIGEAKATTPLLPVGLTGPVYFVSHAGLKFPELVIVLSGYGTTVYLHAETFISPSSGITSSTFRAIPDVPVNTFELTLPQGKYSALAANKDLCKSVLKMPTAFTAQNGATIKQSTPISVTGCTKHRVIKKNTKRKNK
jgi:hypothetical protein